MDVIVTFSTDVTVSGSPSLALNSGGQQRSHTQGIVSFWTLRTLPYRLRLDSSRSLTTVKCPGVLTMTTLIVLQIRH